ncbi:MAG: TauD/TfdA family dioxygenase, partial [Acidimicrobiales bacterium]|nr:TauD/TfdA family dioxygenase [Acidimicrobiales bacterium]
MQQTQTKRLSGTLGLRIDGVDVRHLDDATFAEIQRLFLEYLVLVFPGQDLSPGDEVAFARRWGTIWCHPHIPSLPGHPEVLEVVDPTHPIACHWHQDQTFVDAPPLLTMLYPHTLPDAGGDTLFADQYRAWDSLGPGLREMLAG